MNKKKIINELMIIFWIFVIGSILGYIYEMIVVLFKKGYFESRQGLIYGPFTPVYGIGGIIYYLILNMIDSKNKRGSKETAISNNHFGKLQYYIRIFLITAVPWRYNRVYMLIYSRKGIWNNIMGLFILNV